MHISKKIKKPRKNDLVSLIFSLIAITPQNLDSPEIPFTKAPDPIEEVIKETFYPDRPEYKLFETKTEYQILSEEAYANPRVIRYIPIIEEMAKRYNLPPELIVTVIHRESSGNPNAISKRGAMGLMQLMPITATQYKVTNPFDPLENIETGCRHLRGYIDKFGGDLALGLSAYNTGQRNVVRALKQNTGIRKTRIVHEIFEQHTYHGYQIDPEKLHSDTGEYVRKILTGNLPGF